MSESRSTALMVPSWGDLVRGVAWQRGVEVDDTAVDFILWEHTGFPGFWPAGKPPWQSCIEQVEAFFDTSPEAEI